MHTTPVLNLSVSSDRSSTGDTLLCMRWPPFMSSPQALGTDNPTGIISYVTSQLSSVERVNFSRNTAFFCFNLGAVRMAFLYLMEGKKRVFFKIRLPTVPSLELVWLTGLLQGAWALRRAATLRASWFVLSLTSVLVLFYLALQVYGPRGPGSGMCEDERTNLPVIHVDQRLVVTYLKL